MKAEKYEDNPILKPFNFWSYNGIFNPAAIKIKNKTYIIFRQISKNNISTFGLAISKDGFEIDETIENPIYYPRAFFEIHPSVYENLNNSNYEIFKNVKIKYNKKNIQYILKNSNIYLVDKIFEDVYLEEFEPLMNIKNFSYFGTEDPRSTIIGDKLYLVYIAFNGVSNPKLALTSIRIKDFLKERWDRWEKPVLISHEGFTDKGGVLFPKKIKKKYYFLHRIYPYIWIDAVKDLNEFKNGRFLFGRPIIYPKPDSWDNRKIIAGSSPLEFKGKWLIVYNAVTGWDDYFSTLGFNEKNFKKEDGYRYKIGIIVLDKDFEVIYRSKNPIIEPEEWYEVYSPAKPHVTYACGAVINKNKLFIYYGASDYFTSVASLDLNILKEIIKNDVEEESWKPNSLPEPKKFLGRRRSSKPINNKARKKVCNALQSYFASTTKGHRKLLKNFLHRIRRE